MSNCILWPGYRDKDGYGYVKYKGRMHRAHRLALAKKLGRELKKSEWALHSCHCPSCVNPEHLSVGSAADNNRQSRARMTSLSKNILGLS